MLDNTENKWLTQGFLPMHHDYDESLDPPLYSSDTTLSSPTKPYDPHGGPLPDIPIAFQKSTQIHTWYLIHDYLAYSHLSSQSSAYTYTYIVIWLDTIL